MSYSFYFFHVSTDFFKERVGIFLLNNTVYEYDKLIINSSIITELNN